MSSEKHRPDRYQRWKSAKHRIRSAGNGLSRAWKVIDRPFLLAIVIICTLAVFSEYQVRISLLGGFRFEPAQARPIAPEFSKSAPPTPLSLREAALSCAVRL